MSSYSIIKYFESNHLNYTASSLTKLSEEYSPYAVLDSDKSNFFHSERAPTHQWWQIKFEKPVTINILDVGQLNGQ